ncbi:hypothetical protein RBH94_10205 [Aestuariibaculum sp. YM273]|nr:hypothetical protein [Aestuariibaculum sp. YM273]WMI64432.1 hypothetical protein RBH94_10205 [Aestuariibaculum sp. YM273]
MKDILESNPELLEAFKNEIGKEKKVKEYFIKYINKLNKKDS